MILINNIVSQIKSNLDAEGSDRYRWNLDLQPSVNYAVQQTIDIIGGLLSEKKMAAERLRELVKTYCFQSSKYSKVFIDNIDFNLSKILSVYVLISTQPTWTLQANTTDGSLFLDGFSLTGHQNSCKRITFEERTNAVQNPLSAGYALANPDLIQWGYMEFSTYGSDSYGGYNPFVGNDGAEIEIIPSYPNNVLAITMLEEHPLIQEASEIDFLAASILFPSSLTNFIVSLCCRFLSKKQGDMTTLNKVSNSDIMEVYNILK